MRSIKLLGAGKLMPGRDDGVFHVDNETVKVR